MDENVKPTDVNPFDALHAPLKTLWDNAINSLTTLDFYLQLIAVAAAVLMGLLVASICRRYVKKHEKWHEQRFTHYLAESASQLTAPLVTLILLGIAKPIVNLVTLTGLISAASKLAFAWLIARLLTLIIQSRPLANFVGYAIFGVALLSVTGLLKNTAGYLDSLAFEVGTLKLSVLILIKAITLLAFTFWIANTIARLVETYLLRSPNLNYNTRELILKLTRIFLFFVAFVIALNAVGINLTALAVFGGALGVGIGFGLQKITANFISGIILLFDRSIKSGDLVEVSGDRGWVRQIAVRYTLIETLDGREILIPNESMVASKVTNWTYSSNNVRIDIDIPVAYFSDAVKAKELLLEAAMEYAGAMKEPAPTCFLNRFDPNNLVFNLSFWIEDIAAGRKGAQSDVMYRILSKFKDNGIVMPYLDNYAHLDPASARFNFQK